MLHLGAAVYDPVVVSTAVCDLLCSLSGVEWSDMPPHVIPDFRQCCVAVARALVAGLVVRTVVLDACQLRVMMENFHCAAGLVPISLGPARPCLGGVVLAVDVRALLADLRHAALLHVGVDDGAHQLAIEAHALLAIVVTETRSGPAVGDKLRAKSVERAVAALFVLPRGGGRSRCRRDRRRRGGRNKSAVCHPNIVLGPLPDGAVVAVLVSTRILELAARTVVAVCRADPGSVSAPLAVEAEGPRGTARVVFAFRAALAQRRTNDGELTSVAGGACRGCRFRGELTRLAVHADKVRVALAHEDFVVSELAGGTLVDLNMSNCFGAVTQRVRAFVLDFIVAHCCEGNRTSCGVVERYAVGTGANRPFVHEASGCCNLPDRVNTDHGENGPGNAESGPVVEGPLANSTVLTLAVSRGGLELAKRAVFTRFAPGPLLVLAGCAIAARFARARVKLAYRAAFARGGARG